MIDGGKSEQLGVVQMEPTWTQGEKGGRFLRERYAQTYDRLRTSLTDWLNPERFSGDDAGLVKTIRDVIGEPVTIMGDSYVGSGDQMTDSLVRATTVHHDDKQYPAFVLMRGMVERLAEDAPLQQPSDEVLVAWCRGFEAILRQIPEGKRGKGDLSGKTQSQVFGPTTTHGEVTPEVFANLQVMTSNPTRSRVGIGSRIRL